MIDKNINITDDFKNILNENGYKEEDFVIKKNGKTNYEEGALVAVREEVIITFIPTGKEKTYKAGHRTNWEIDFEKDLKEGFFE